MKTYYKACLLSSFLCFSTVFAQFKIVGYLPTWAGFPNSIKNVDLDKVTHINIAFANANTSGAITGVSASKVDTVVKYAHAKGVKVLLSIGGAGAPAATYKTLLSNTTNTSTFINNMVQYAIAHKLDGIDMDIEGDVLDGTNVTSAQYETFVTQLATALHAQSMIMTSALATWFGKYVTKNAAAQFDFINVMSYDYTIPSSSTAGQVAPYSQMTSDFQYWNVTKGVSGSKLVIGVPFYGYGWGTYKSTDEISYCTIVNTYSGAENNDVVGSGNNAIYYNGIPTIKQKTTYAVQKASGIMIWQITEDCSTSDSRSLLKAIYETSQTVTALPQDVVAAQNGWNVFPNPVTEDATIELNRSLGETIERLTLYNQQGSVVYTSTQVNALSSIVPMKELPQGLYTLKVATSSGRILSGKVVR